MNLPLERVTRLLLDTLDDVNRLSGLLDSSMQQNDNPAFELSPEGGEIRYLNQAACEVIGLEPQQAVGTRLITYVADGLMTQRRLEALNQQSQAQTWPDAWRRGRQTIPCQLAGFAIPRALASSRDRLIVWVESPPSPPHRAPARPGEEPTPPLIADHEFVRAGDLVRLRQKLKLGINRFCELVGITTVSWYTWTKTPEAPIFSRTLALHMRLLDRFPDLATAGAQPLDLQEALRVQMGLDLTYMELALLLGVERRAAYGWARGQTAGEQVQALTTSLLHLVLERPRQDWNDYRYLLDRQAELEGVDLKTTQSWSISGQRSRQVSDEAPVRLSAGRPYHNQPKSQASGLFEGVEDTKKNMGGVEADKDIKDAKPKRRARKKPTQSQRD